MLKKIVGKAVAGAAAAGLVLVPSATAVAAPQDGYGECQYPDEVITDTTLRLSSYIAPYGTQTVARVTVRGEGDPRGEVHVRVAGVGTWTRTLKGDSVTVALPRTLGAQEAYRVTAKFIGKCDYKNSSDHRDYIVVKSAVNVNPYVVNRRQAQFAATLRGQAGLNPQGGEARVTVQRLNGKVVRAGSDRVDNGRAYVNLPNLGAGKYRLVVKYFGTPNFRFGQDSVVFRIGRHR
jgi:hypothetical protein